MLCASAVLAENCHLEQIAAVDLVVTKSGSVQIPVEINGIRVQMGIEAGSGLSAIWSGATAALNLQPQERIRPGVLHAGGIPLTQTVHINSFKLGNLHWQPFDALVYPRNHQFSQSLGEDEVVGYLGQDMFSGVDLELDFGAHQLRLYSQKHCPGKVTYWSSDYDVLALQRNALGNLYMSMAVNGRLVATSLSTLNSISILEEGAAKNMGLDGASAGIDAGVGGDGCSFCGSINLKAQGLEIQNARVKIVNTVAKDCRLSVPRGADGIASYNCLGAFPLRLGVNVLSKLHLYFANGEKKLYFTVADVNAGNTTTGSAGIAPTAP